MGYLGGAWLRRRIDQPPEKSRLTPAWARKVSRKYQSFISRYWEAAQDDALDSMASSGVVSQQEVIQLGQEMFEALPWSVQEKLRLGLRHARQQSRGLRVILEFNEADRAAAEVAQLPWELLYDPGIENFLVLAGPLSIGRRLPDVVPVRLLDLKLPLRLLHGFVLLEDEQGRSQRVDGRFLRSLFNDVSTLQFVVLSVCHSGKTSASLSNKPDESEGPIVEMAHPARLIVKDGLPAVVAMQSQIGLQANRFFLQALVDVLGEGGSLDEAVQQGRKAEPVCT